MKNVLLVSLLLCIILLSSGCAESNIIDISTNDFSKMRILSEKRIQTKEMLNIRNLTVQDSFLFVNNSREDSLFMIYNLNTQEILKAWGTRGKGPDEYGLFTHLIKVSSNNIQIADFSRYKIEEYVIPSFQLKSRTDILKNHQFNTERVFPRRIVTSDGQQFYYDMLLGNKLSLNRWDLGDDPVMINDFNHAINSLESSKSSIGSLAINSNANKIVYAYRFLRQFDIISSDGKLKKTIRVSPSLSSSLFTKHIDKKDLNMCYIDAKIYKESFFLLYIGHSPKEIESNNFMTHCYIEEYDWDGNPLNLYRVNRFISHFDIYENNNSKLFIGVDITNEHPLIILNPTAID
ncbi:MAG TPA: BF3164 family lipoprotein [Edaphocola sp.]|nr:BF3164 family lipoprotein [Edaphocola sp.]